MVSIYTVPVNESPWPEAVSSELRVICMGALLLGVWAAAIRSGRRSKVEA